jgi:hypothetical protein
MRKIDTALEVAKLKEAHTILKEELRTKRIELYNIAIKLNQALNKLVEERLK